MDLLVYAIKMELDGEAFYKEQAQLNQGNVLYQIFMNLANEESEHALILDGKKKEFNRSESVVLLGQNVFTSLSDSDMKSLAQQLDAYQSALEKEKESIDLYKRLLDHSVDSTDLYEFLISQEEQHYAVIQEIIKIVRRPSEWVESAEFGRREEY